MKPGTKTRTVFKYDVPVKDLFRLDLPLGARILSVDVQRGYPQMWVLHDAWAAEFGGLTPHNPEVNEAVTQRRTFRLAGTGHAIQAEADKLEFIGTFMLRGGDLVFHLFEIKD